MKKVISVLLALIMAITSFAAVSMTALADGVFIGKISTGYSKAFDGKEEVYSFRFTPTKTAKYKFYTTGNCYSFGNIYNPKTYDDETGDFAEGWSSTNRSGNFSMTKTLKKGTVYTMEAIYISGNGGFTVHLNEAVAKPKATYITKITRQRKALKISWKKVSGVKGYQVQVARNSKFTTGKKTTTVSSASTTTKTIKNLNGRKTYYVRVRTYKVVNGKKVYSSWSKAKKTTTK